MLSEWDRECSSGRRSGSIAINQNCNLHLPVVASLGFDSRTDDIWTCRHKLTNEMIFLCIYMCVCVCVCVCVFCSLTCRGYHSTSSLRVWTSLGDRLSWSGAPRRPRYQPHTNLKPSCALVFGISSLQWYQSSNISLSLQLEIGVTFN